MKLIVPSQDEILEAIKALPISIQGHEKLWGSNGEWEEIELADETYHALLKGLIGTKYTGTEILSKAHILELAINLNRRLDLTKLLKRPEDYSQVFFGRSPE